MTGRVRLSHECKTYVFVGDELSRDERQALADQEQIRELWRVEMHSDRTYDIYRNNVHVVAGSSDSRSLDRARALVEVQLEKRDAAQRDAARLKEAQEASSEPAGSL